MEESSAQHRFAAWAWDVVLSAAPGWALWCGPTFLAPPRAAPLPPPARTRPTPARREPEEASR